MPAIPPSDIITDCDETIIDEHTKKHTSTYNDYPLLKLKKMMIAVDKPVSENGNMDFSVFKNISLDSKQLTYLPSNFAQNLVNLVSLSLSDNKLEELPYSFRSLTKLEHLKINNNLLANLPNSFVELKHLKTLSLISNKLTSLPEHFGCLINLEYLDLSNNNITKLPISCVALNKLSKLIVQDNNLVEIPECVINGMKNLRILNVSNNPGILMNKAPASIHLTTFIANDNRDCNHFPQWILWIKYSKLRTVKMDNTRFRKYSFPHERTALQIKELSMIQSNLADNVIREILINMVKLESLDLSNESDRRIGNYFWILPFENMRVFHTLKDVNIKGTSLPALSNKIQQFCNLEKLDLSQNQISWLPENFASLGNLQVLRINNSKIIQLPEDIGRLRNLRELWASGNTIPNIPESLFELKELRVLDLYDNCIEEISSEISRLEKLEQLDLDQNLCDVSYIVIQNTNYEDLKSVLRQNEDFNNRTNGFKLPTENMYDSGDDYRNEFFGDRFSHSDESSSFSESDGSGEAVEMLTNEKKEESEARTPSPENWDIPENPADNFEPCDTGLLRTAVNYYISASTHKNYYRPADDHQKPIRQILIERDLLRRDTFEEGQFDDA